VSKSVWMNTGTERSPALKGNYRADVAIVGAGISGIMTALFLRDAGKSVILLDKSEPPSGESCLTTGHVTEVLDYRFSDLIHKFGQDEASEISAASRRGLELLRRRIEQDAIACDWEDLPAYLYIEKYEDREYLKEELAALRTLGIFCKYSDSAPLPFPTVGCIEIADQAQFHPVKYLHTLLSRFRDRGGLIFGNSKVTQLSHGEPCEVLTEHARVLATDVVVCTNDPISHPLLMHTKIASYRTYAIAVTAKLQLPVPGLFWDTEDPYHYTRHARNGFGSVLVIGGEDHKTGTESDTEQCLERLRAFAHERFEVSSVEDEWSGQIIETVDSLPYIGQDTQNPHFYVATGFSGNGLTWGALASEIIANQVLGIHNRYSELFRPNRINPTVSAGRYVAENKDFPICFIGDRIKEAESMDDLHAEEGAIVNISGKRVAAYRNSSGDVRCLSPICPHMGCYVRWNNSEKTWDCPCHGSRFDDQGQVLNGPAMEGLEPVVFEDPAENNRAIPLRLLS
jgi:glycine/D-amino acid oxidase-like deaminating enzyme/nitrite reductase/ring-hydroxylating ferredoxin subunit